MSDQWIQILRQEHSNLHREFVWKSDKETFDKIEYWTHPKRVGSKLYGDCDDWTIEMDSRVRAKGVPLDVLRYALCKYNPQTTALYDHVGLALVANNKIYISECNSTQVQELSHLGYTNWYFSDPRNISANWIPLAALKVK